MKIVLNVGGSSKTIPIPEHYSGWKHELLDLFPIGECEYKVDLHDIATYEFPHQFDAVYCSHTLEHNYLHEALGILQSFYKVLKRGGLVEIRVPHFRAAVEKYLETSNLFAPLYTTQDGLPVTIQDVVYGHQNDLRNSNFAMAHKCAFDIDTLGFLLGKAGFIELQDWSVPEAFELRVTGWKEEWRGIQENPTQHSDGL